MNYTKSYIGKGKKVEGKDIVKVTLPFEKLKALTYKYEGVEYLTFELAKMQNKDDYGRSHTAYVSVREVEEEIESTAAKKARKEAEKAVKKAAKAAKTEEPVLETAESEIPF
jgi:phage protein D